MASINRVPNSPFYCIRFRFRGQNVQRSLGVREKRRALALLGRLEETIRLLELGHLEIPSDVDCIEFLLTGGKEQKSDEDKPSPIGLKKLFEEYEEARPTGQKEESTIYCEGIHIEHLKRILGARKPLVTFKKNDLQKYVNKRLKEKYNGKPIQPETIKKELATFRMLWNWAVEEELLIGICPTKKVVYPLTDEKPPFMTRKEIENILARGHLDKRQSEEIWEALYLDKEEITDVLQQIQAQAVEPFVYPMMLFVAHTGARRSEVIRSRVEDIDFRSGIVFIREKKKSRKKATTYRRVEMSPLLREVMEEWLKAHSGGQQTFCRERGIGVARTLSVWAARDLLKKTLARTSWQCIRGFHVFRHSFASNLAAAGVDQRVIDEFMGHQTEEMRRRYRHLLPIQRKSAISAVFGNDNDEDPSGIRQRA